MPWLLKAEPDSRIVKGQDVKYTIDDLKAERTGTWDGVRNNEARKHMLAMRKGDKAFFYRSNCKEPGIVGTMTIAKEAYPDKTAGDPNAPYYDPKTPDRWVVVDVQYESHLPNPVLLHSIKAKPELQDMQLVKRSRLSVTPVTGPEWETVLKMSRAGSTVDEQVKAESEGVEAKKPKTVKENGPSARKRSISSEETVREKKPSQLSKRKRTTAAAK